jgi:DNA-binding response OmpR family regulator
LNTLLIADDEAGIRSLVRMTLADSAYEIIEASDGHEALALAKEHKPKLALLDVQMPGLSGLEVCRQLKSDAETQDIFVVMLTARAQEADVEAGNLAGADDYFTKPFSPVALMRKVDEVFSSRTES